MTARAFCTFYVLNKMDESVNLEKVRKFVAISVVRAEEGHDLKDSATSMGHRAAGLCM